MSKALKEKNVEERISRSREMIEHEAMILYSIYDEARKAGHDFEKVLRKAVEACSVYEGRDIAEACSDLGDLKSFGESFGDEFWSSIHDMQILEVGKDRLKINFHSCAYVDAWRKIDAGREDMELLCDILMDGDRCIAKSLNYKFELGKTIAQGNHVCELDFRK